MAVLGHDDLQGRGIEAAGLLLGVVVLPVEEDHPVRVLLDGPRIPQVGELGDLVALPLGLAVELAEHQHRDAQGPGQGLECAGDLGHVLDAVLALGPLSGGDLADVVHHQELDPLDLPGQEGDVVHRHRGALADMHRQSAELGAGLGQSPPLRLGELVHQETVARDPGETAQALGHELLLVHLQGDEEDRAGPLGHPVGDVEGHGGLAHAGTGRQNVHAAGEHPAPQQDVDVPEAGGHKAAGRALLHPLPVGKEGQEGVVGGQQVPGHPLGLEVLDAPPGVGQKGDRLVVLVRPPLELLPQAPDGPAHRLLPHLPGIDLHVGGGGRDLQELHQVLAAHVRVLAADLLQDGHQIHRLVLPGQLDRRPVDLLVRLQGEVLRPEQLLHHRQAPAIQQDGADHGLLGLHAVSHHRPPPPPRRSRPCGTCAAAEPPAGRCPARAPRPPTGGR